MFIRAIFKDSKNVNRMQCTKMQSVTIFPDISKFANFPLKNADVSRTQGVCHVIYMLSGSSSGEVQLHQVLSL